MKDVNDMKQKKLTAIEKKREKDIEKCLKDDIRGLSTVEYLILLVVIAVASISIWNKIGAKVKGHAEKSDTAIGTIGNAQ